MTRQTDALSYMEVDYQGNKNLLDGAIEASVRKFVFVHVFSARLLNFMEGIQAKQTFIEHLQKADLGYAIVCPTGFFNDMAEFLRMAKRGTVYQIGDGQKKINPIHGAGLAKVCVDSVTGDRAEIPVGGPVTYTYREIAELAFAVLGRPPRIRRVPAWMAKLLVSVLRLVSKRHYTMAAGITTITQTDCVAPNFGTHTLKEFYEEIAPKL